eukprot:COSAG01_NODE_927_length_12693_cov_16.333810_8_plen_93_part_00
MKLPNFDTMPSPRRGMSVYVSDGLAVSRSLLNAVCVLVLVLKLRCTPVGFFEHNSYCLVAIPSAASVHNRQFTPNGQLIWHFHVLQITRKHK